MFANPEKFQAIVVQHNKSINENYTLKVNNIETKSKNSVKLLGIEIVNKLLFDKYMVSLCKKAANQLHAICRLQNQMGQKEKGILTNRFLFTQTLIITQLSDMPKIEKIQSRCLLIILDNYESNCDALLYKIGKPTMEVKRLRTVAVEMFKTLNNQNPSFMREIFYRSPYASHEKQNLFVQSHKTAAFF